MLCDRYGNEVSTTNTSVLDEVNLFELSLMKQSKDTPIILRAAEEYPEEPLPLIYAAIFKLYAQAEGPQKEAKRLLSRAKKLISSANEREQSLHRATFLWSKMHIFDALIHFEMHCKKWPKDLTALKVAEFLFYCNGQKYHSHAFLSLTKHCHPFHVKDPFFYSIHSFALELNGLLDESKSVAEEALQLDAENPWAHHTLTHVYMNKGLIEEGIVLFENYARQWPDYLRPMESHNGWHLGLFYLENLDYEKAYDTYRRFEVIDQNISVGVEIDAAALLWRLEMEGQGNLLIWKKLAESIGDHANFGCIPFISAQLCYALKKGERLEALQTALEHLEKFAQKQKKEDKHVWSEVGMPLIYGSLAFADQQYGKALNYFDPMIHKVGCVGGSDAQIDLFFQTYLKCLIGGKRYTDAKAFLENLTKGRPKSKLEQKWLAECTQKAKG